MKQPVLLYSTPFLSPNLFFFKTSLWILYLHVLIYLFQPSVHSVFNQWFILLAICYINMFAKLNQYNMSI